MKHVSLDNLYNEIIHLSDSDRYKLFNRMKKEFYPNAEIVAYTTEGEALTIEQYKKRVNAGIEQCMRGESISLEDLSKELGYDYAEL